MLYAVFILIGVFVGLFMKNITVQLISCRVKDKDFIKKTTTKYTVLVWILLFSSLWMTAALVGGLSIESVRFALVGTICFSLSAVDLNIRKIPNELLLSLLIIQIISLIIGWDINDLLTSVGGMIAGLILFMLPSYIGKAAGLGDVKFAATTGFILGFHGLIAAVLIMALIIIVYTAYLIVTKKGGLKTKLALGPYMTTGIIAVMIINILSNTSYLDLTKLMLQ
ncbi:MAG: prepilin peptidase [Eubacteriales bacterium]